MKRKAGIQKSEVQVRWVEYEPEDGSSLNWTAVNDFGQLLQGASGIAIRLK